MTNPDENAISEKERAIEYYEVSLKTQVNELKGALGTLDSLGNYVSSNGMDGLLEKIETLKSKIAGLIEYELSVYRATDGELLTFKQEKEKLHSELHKLKDEIFREDNAFLVMMRRFAGSVRNSEELNQDIYDEFYEADIMFIQDILNEVLYLIEHKKNIVYCGLEAYVVEILKDIESFIIEVVEIMINLVDSGFLPYKKSLIRKKELKLKYNARMGQVANNFMQIKKLIKENFGRDNEKLSNDLAALILKARNTNEEINKPRAPRRPRQPSQPTAPPQAPTDGTVGILNEGNADSNVDYGGEGGDQPPIRRRRDRVPDTTEGRLNS